MKPSQEAEKKLRRLHRRLSFHDEWAFPYDDADNAIRALQKVILKALGRLKGIEAFQEQLRLETLREINYSIIRISKIMRVLSQAASVRNPFELYAIFLSVCKSLVDGDVKLVLSSEWDYIPLTYPQNLDELPGFIIIGMPASESENILVFPLAGHELGHSVWRRHKIYEQVAGQIGTAVFGAYEANRIPLAEAYPDTKNVDLKEDLFAQNIMADSAMLCALQAEEVFCDLVALLLFREGYLHAFHYLVSPTLAGSRSGRYPATQDRSKILAKYGERLKLNCSLEEFVRGFTNERMISGRQAAFRVLMADEALDHVVDSLFDIAQKLIQGSGTPMPTEKGRDDALEYISNGVPYDKPTALGNLINAAWAQYREHVATEDDSVRPIEDYLSDLVLKSAEFAEFNQMVEDAGSKANH